MFKKRAIQLVVMASVFFGGLGLPGDRTGPVGPSSVQAASSSLEALAMKKKKKHKKKKHKKKKHKKKKKSAAAPSSAVRSVVRG